MKIVVPEGMLKAAIVQALTSGKVMNRRQWTEFFDSADATCVRFTKEILEAALEWLAENPMVPTNLDIRNLGCDGNGSYTLAEIQAWMTEWQCRMFLAPEAKEK